MPPRWLARLSDGWQVLRAQLSQAKAAVEEAQQQTPFLSQLKAESAKVRAKALKEATAAAEAASQATVAAHEAARTVVLATLTDELRAMESAAAAPQQSWSAAVDVLQTFAVDALAVARGAQGGRAPSGGSPPSTPPLTRPQRGATPDHRTTQANVDVTASGLDEPQPTVIPLSKLEQKIVALQGQSTDVADDFDMCASHAPPVPTLGTLVSLR